MAKRTSPYNKSGTEKLPDNKPAIYKIKTEGGKTNYIGSAKKGRVQARIQEHLNEGKIPGANVEIEQKNSIGEARKTEQRSIKRTKPKYNK